VFARGTTLGGDDGIAVAMALAVLEAHDLPHPRIEAVFTVDEETGMYGAAALDVTPLRGRRLLNMDSEAEGIFTVSCAGGNISRLTVPVERVEFDGAALSITVEGLQGGHSGAEIHKGRGNANMLLGRVLLAAWQKTDLRIVSLGGGLKDNAIPVKAEALVLVADEAAAKAACAEMGAILADELRTADPGVQVNVASGEKALAMDAAATERLLCLLNCAPNGIQTMSADMPGLVQASLNLGVLTTAETAVTASFCIRSSVESQKQMMVDRLTLLARQLGGTLTVEGDYPGWAYRQDSPLRDLMAEVFAEQYGHAPKIEAIHAGLECGMLAGKLPGLDCVSFGPDLTDIHTFREKLHIASTARTWALLVEVLRRMK